MLTLSPAVQLWFCTTPVSMRLGFNGLYSLVANRLQKEPLSGHLFIFTNRNYDRLKILYWGGYGLCLWCQRLEAGRYHFPKPQHDAQTLQLTAAQLQLVLDGIDLSKVRRHKRFQPGTANP